MGFKLDYQMITVVKSEIVNGTLTKRTGVSNWIHSILIPAVSTYVRRFISRKQKKAELYMLSDFYPSQSCLANHIN